MITGGSASTQPARGPAVNNRPNQHLWEIDDLVIHARDAKEHRMLHRVVAFSDGRREVSSLWCQKRHGRCPLGVCIHDECDRRYRCSAYQSVSSDEQLVAIDDLRSHGHDIIPLQMPLLDAR